MRLFAALREAAGVAQADVAAARLPDLLARLCAEHGALFARRLSVSSVMLDGRRVSRDADESLEDVREVALLPPFAGGDDAGSPCTSLSWLP